MRGIKFAGSPSGGSLSAPPQPEAIAYFGRMSVSPSAVFRDAVNTAIYRWKTLGIWTKVIQLVFMAAETQQAALLDMSAAANNASVAGTPTFTSHKGFSNFSASNGVAFGLTPTILIDDNFTSILAAVLDLSKINTQVVENATNGTAAGCFAVNGVGQVAGSGGTPLSVPAPLIAAAPFIGGNRNIVTVLPGFAGQSGGTNPTRQSSYKTSLLATPALTRLLAYGSIASTASADDARRFMAVLARLLDDLSAFN